MSCFTLSYTLQYPCFLWPTSVFGVGFNRTQFPSDFCSQEALCHRQHRHRKATDLIGLETTPSGGLIWVWVKARCHGFKWSEFGFFGMCGYSFCGCKVVASTPFISILPYGFKQTLNYTRLYNMKHGPSCFLSWKAKAIHYRQVANIAPSFLLKPEMLAVFGLSIPCLACCSGVPRLKSLDICYVDDSQACHLF